MNVPVSMDGTPHLAEGWLPVGVDIGGLGMSLNAIKTGSSSFLEEGLRPSAPPIAKWYQAVMFFISWKYKTI